MYRITTESICDVDVNYLQQRNCDVLFYSYTADGKEYLDDMWRQPQQQESLYAALQKGKPSTSLINQSRYEQFFLERLQTEDVLHIAFSSGLSSSANNAFLAAQKIEKMNLPHKLKVVDTLSGCGGMALLVEHALDMRDGGATMEEVWCWLEDNKLRPRHYFFTSDLSYLRRSGRVSGAVMLIGNLLRLCPVMRATDEGKLVAYAKTITAKKSRAKTHCGNALAGGRGRRLRQNAVRGACVVSANGAGGGRSGKTHLPPPERYPHFPHRLYFVLPLRAGHDGNFLLGKG